MSWRQKETVGALLLPVAHSGRCERWGEMTVINHGRSQLYDSLLLSDSAAAAPSAIKLSDFTSDQEKIAIFTGCAHLVIDNWSTHVAHMHLQANVS